MINLESSGTGGGEAQVPEHPNQSMNPRRFNMKSVEELRAEITALEQQIKDARKCEERAREERMKATPKVYEFTLKKEDPKVTFEHDAIYDPAVIRYRLVGHIVNKDEAEAVGHRVDDDGDGMNYLFNSATGRIVCRGGGGRIWIGGFGYGEAEKEANVVAMNVLAEFIKLNPDGGDITDEVLILQQAKREAKQQK